MRALAYFKKGDIHFADDLPEPTIENDEEVLIDVSWCGICGTDLHEYLDGPIFMPRDGGEHPLSGKRLPQPMGHEMSGIVSKIGSKVTKVKAGDHVVVEAGCSCLDIKRWENSSLKTNAACSACAKGMVNCCAHAGFTGLGVTGGGFAERVTVSQDHCVVIPKELPLDVAALVEPLSVTWHAAKIAGFQKGQTACVMGAGPIGLAAVLVLKGFGASKIVVSELASIRRDLASSLGVEVFNPAEHADAIEELRKIPVGQDGFDAAFDCSGVKATFDTALHVTTFRGVSVNVAIWGNKPIDYHPMDVTLKEKRLTGSIGYTVEDFREVVEAIHSGRIPLQDCRQLITGKQKLEDGWEKGFLELMNHKETNVKILLTPNNHNELNA
ncbi:hypothetical protein HG536_0F04700 [Torulaspora globosa]|uniref:Enoyl reductase (ER) domain-containing protein n=1 Tax=Torulaspora globosa TaxID=48254 RepID=A0A7G3ZKV7_9SACH|nr:uncharacterized protein HG536_0F04700 [Torulaspora globosa]QLL34143.1 hypothetical protein HG536_0F04700 [Torulaspora globosa]